MIKRGIYVIVACTCCACVIPATTAHKIGIREAARLREAHAQWLGQRERKLDVMHVPPAALSENARRAGFLEGSVDSRLVLLWTRQGDEAGEGLAFGSLSVSEIEGLRSLGLELVPIDRNGTYKFTLRSAGGLPPAAPTPSVQGTR